MKSSGLADSPLFSKPKYMHDPIKKNAEEKKRIQPCNHTTTASRHHETTVSEIKKAIKIIGKEAATHRLSQSEKRAIYEIIYHFRLSGIRVSENEITRIAINYIIINYQNNNKTSILSQVVSSDNK